MKKIFAFALIMIAANGVFAQDAITKFFTKYQDDESFTQVLVSSKMFSMFTNMEVESKEDQEVLNAISKLKGLKILAKENTSDARKLYKEAYTMIPVKEYEELMSVRDKDKDMKFYVKETGGKISELLMIVGGADDFMIMSLFGEIDLKQVSRMGKKMDVKGLENLEKIEEKKN